MKKGFHSLRKPRKRDEDVSMKRWSESDSEANRLYPGEPPHVQQHALCVSNFKLVVCSVHEHHLNAPSMFS